LDVLLLGFEAEVNCGMEAGWKLYENLFWGMLSFLLTGMIELSEPKGFKGLDRYFL
jgi:hypothetical protein